jgi:hypothetical protein
MTDTSTLLNRLPNDIGGVQAGPVERVEHEFEPWEKRTIQRYGPGDAPEALRRSELLR